MTYKPKQDKIVTPLFMFILFLVFVFTFVFGTKSDGYMKWILNGIAVFAAVFAMDISNRYILCRYIYILDGDSLKIYCVRGKRSTLFANIRYTEMLALSEKGKKVNVGKLCARYYYVQNLFPKNPKTLYFIDRDKNASLEIEADEQFFGALLTMMPAKNV